MQIQFGMAKLTAKKIPSIPSSVGKKSPIDIPRTSDWSEWVTTANNQLGLRSNQFDTVEKVTVQLWQPEDNPQSLPRRRNGKQFHGVEITMSNHHQGAFLATKRPIKAKGKRIPENKLVMITKPEGNGTKFTGDDNLLAKSILGAGAQTIEVKTTPVRKLHNPLTWFRRVKKVSYSKPRS